MGGLSDERELIALRKCGLRVSINALQYPVVNPSGPGLFLGFSCLSTRSNSSAESGCSSVVASISDMGLGLCCEKNSVIN